MATFIEKIIETIKAINSEITVGKVWDLRELDEDEDNIEGETGMVWKEMKDVYRQYYPFVEIIVDRPITIGDTPVTSVNIVKGGKDDSKHPEVIRIMMLKDEDSVTAAQRARLSQFLAVFHLDETRGNNS